MLKLFSAAAVILTLALPARAGDIQVIDAFVRGAPVAGGNGAAFMTIRNTAAQPDRLIGASAPVGNATELHTHIKDGDVFRMRRVDAIAVPANGEAKLQPGGDHIMMMGLKQPLKEGDKVPLTLTFEKAGTVSLDVPVLAPGAMGPHPMHSDMHHQMMMQHQH